MHKRYLPALVKQYEKFKKACHRSKDEKMVSADMPDLPFQFLSSLELGPAEWMEIARNASWQTTRMNLNTFARHDVFKSEEMIKLLADRLRNADQIRRARVFPYQLLAAYLNTDDEKVPRELRNALQDAMEIAVDNVPDIDGPVYVFPDVSGSMRGAVTGTRKGSTSKVSCVHVAALVAASMLRRNPNAEVIPFENSVVRLPLNPRDSIMTNAARLASVGGGGTNCSAPLVLLNQRKVSGAALCLYVSDNESWVDSERIVPDYWGRLSRGGQQATATMQAWREFRQRNPEAKLVCIDLQPQSTTQATGQNRPEILNIGGFSDQVFNVVGDFVNGDLGGARWMATIDAIRLDGYQSRGEEVVKTLDTEDEIE
jgi:60 kDa SS-A/Ro ribonucleoprotein